MEKSNKLAEKKGRKKGIVVSDKMDKTIVVRVDSLKTHSKYKKKYKVSKRYKVHDEKNEKKIGDTVEIFPARPKSKDKKYNLAQ
ncbi:MAG: 30S ribosomal protein S17 [Candidatus Moranbacteria bacterium CG_4_8_14_3_um_filter_34_16]|nr:MAG: 30S ribosomal protein S17 [Candidatus Moranbacteria bacterium CG08_land_8_20_14_0_20_34_16]PIW95287.1 MAG: 30S ribosomal protein S17 [Candidatus Moranbacteria bacterium CG_4_8_14_3_um_filter_34_16]PJA89233.1 MAG: 30S ribosomal protein S17 [Candidatus Moranbacteria bacterium CG_4_9_14_3_um_filter_33_15]